MAIKSAVQNPAVSSLLLTWLVFFVPPCASVVSPRSVLIVAQLPLQVALVTLLSFSTRKTVGTKFTCFKIKYI